MAHIYDTHIADKNIFRNILDESIDYIKSNPKYNAILIIDNLLLVDEMDNYLKNIIMNGRHYNMRVIIINNMLVIDPAIRLSIDYYFVDKDFSDTFIRKVYDMLYSSYLSYKSFMDYYKLIRSDDVDYMMLRNTLPYNGAYYYNIND